MLVCSNPVNAGLINFDDGTHNIIVGNTYFGLGVTFNNVIFKENFSLPGSTLPFAIVGMGGPTLYSFSLLNAIEASFSIDVNSVSVSGLDVGGNGIKMDAVDIDGNPLGSDEWYGTGEGVGTFPTLTISSSLIARVLIYQPSLDTLIDFEGNMIPEGMLVDNFIFEVATVPLPSAILLFSSGLLGLARVRRRKK